MSDTGVDTAATAPCAQATLQRPKNSGRESSKNETFLLSLLLLSVQMFPRSYYHEYVVYRFPPLSCA